jgi:hypothetical protein
MSLISRRLLALVNLKYELALIAHFPYSSESSSYVRRRSWPSVAFYGRTFKHPENERVVNPFLV